jgi:hypothetical protein
MGLADKPTPPEARSTTLPTRRDRSPRSVCGSSAERDLSAMHHPRSPLYLGDFALAMQGALTLTQIHFSPPKPLAFFIRTSDRGWALRSAWKAPLPLVWNFRSSMAMNRSVGSCFRE